MRFEYGANEIEHALGMAARSDLVKRPCDALVRIEHESRTRRDSSAKHAEGARQFALGVREQGERKRMLFRECAMGFDRIDADPDDCALEPREGLVEVAKFLALDRASGRVVGR